jgi:hypothetical protein
VPRLSKGARHGLVTANVASPGEIREISIDRWTRIATATVMVYPTVGDLIDKVSNRHRTIE